MRRRATEEEERDEDEIAWLQGFGDDYAALAKSKPKANEYTPVIIGTINAHYLENKGTPGLLAMQEAMKGQDIQGLSEHNLNFSKIRQEDQLKERFKKTWRTAPKSKTSWIRDRDWKRNEKQLGGVALMAHGNIADFTQEYGEDTAGLARWCWMCYEGQSHIKTAVFQIYRPVYNREYEGSVYMQQASRMSEEDVLKKYDVDLLKQVDAITEDGYRVVIMGDFNMDVTDTSNFLVQELRNRGISERITGRHGNFGAPNTFRYGSKVIDGVFTSEDMEIIRCGMCAGDPAVSDHRMIWIETTQAAMLGQDCGEMFKPETRRLQARYKKVVKKFNQLLVKQMINHKLLHRAEGLWNQWSKDGVWTPSLAATYEKLDQQFARAVAHADKKCRKLFPDAVKFSPEVRRALGRHSVWKEVRKKVKRKQKVHTRWLINMKNKWDLDEMFEVPETVEECDTKVMQAWELFRGVKARSPELRDHFLDLLIREAESKSDPESKSKARQLKGIRKGEKVRDSHQRIRYSSGKGSSCGVKFIHHEREDGTIETITDKHRMVEIIMEKNSEKLHQSNAPGIPLRQQPLLDTLTRCNYDKWESFLRGEIEIPDGLEDGTVAWLNKFKGMDLDHDIDMICDHKELIRAWSKVKEKTSSLPHPCHYGTMKTMKWCQMAAKFHTVMSNIPLATGYSPQSWQHDVEAMLQKKENEWRPDKLRRISLLHPAFNMNNRRIGRLAMKAAEERGLLAEEQFGSRKKRSAEKHALNKRLMLDVMRISRTPGILSANDAKSCYDRILHFATYVSLRRVGVPKPAVVSMIHTLRSMKHKVRTAYGDSSTTYGGEADDDPHGASQGNAAGPAIWALVSSPLLDILREKGYGAEFISPIRREFFMMCGFAFVDDTDTIQTADEGTLSEELIAITQEGLDLWECLIRSTGGAIVGKKSDFTVINWTWKDGKPRYAKEDKNLKLSVLNEHGQREELKHLPTSSARRTLGVWQAADGNEKRQTIELKKKSKKWSDSVGSSNLSKADTHLGLQTSLYPSITYGLMATTLNERQCKEVFTPIRNRVLPRLAVCRTVPAALVHGPVEYGGMGIKDLYTLQGIAHIKALIEEGGKPSATGKLVRILMEYHTLEAGLGESIFEIPHGTLKECMTDTWLKSTVEFTQNNDIVIQSHMDNLELWTDTDTFIMQDAIEAGYEGQELSAINRCRMHLRVVTRSDMGLHSIRENNMDVRYQRNDTNLSSLAYRWPPQPRPPVKDRRVWHQFLMKSYDVDDDNREYNIVGGAWSRKAVKKSPWAYDTDDKVLYERVSKRCWRLWGATKRRRCDEGDYKLLDVPQKTKLPARAQLAIVSPEHRLDNRARVTGIEETQGDTSTYQARQTVANTGASTLREQLAQVHPNLQWAIEDIKLPEDDGIDIANAILTGEGRCMSDGSLKDDFGTSAFTVLLNNKANMYEGTNRVPGEDDEQSSYRSELCGILGNTIMMNAICTLHGIKEPCEIIVGSDSESALWNAFGDVELSTQMASVDIVAAIRNQLQISPLKWTSKWVKGHQDQKGVTTVLDEWATANVRCDELANDKWVTTMDDNSGDPRPEVGTLPGESWTIWLNGRKRSTNLDKALYRHAKADDIISYWGKIGRISEGTHELVDWDGHKAAMKAFRTRRLWLAKHFSGWGGSGVMLNRRKERDNAACHKCGTPETTIHTVQCQHESTIVNYNNAKKPLHNWLKKTTSVIIMQAVMEMMDAYQEDRGAANRESTNEHVNIAMMYQASIGMRSFGEGLLSRHWQLAQRQYNLQKGGHETSKRWVSRLIQHLWEISWTLWEKRNEEIHRNAEVRRGLHAGGLLQKIELLKMRSQFCLMLSAEERKFFAMTIADLSKKRERNQLEWIARGEQFLNSDRLSRRLQNTQGRMYRWLAGNGNKRRRLITDHMAPNAESNIGLSDTNDQGNLTTPLARLNMEHNMTPQRTTERSRQTKQSEITAYFGTT